MHRPSVGRYIGRLSVDYRSTIGRLSVDYRPTIDRLSTDYRPTIDRLSTDYRPTIDRLSVGSRPIVDRYIGRLSADISTEATYSTHDPISLQNFGMMIFGLEMHQVLYLSNLSGFLATFVFLFLCYSLPHPQCYMTNQIVVHCLVNFSAFFNFNKF